MLWSSRHSSCVRKTTPRLQQHRCLPQPRREALGTPALEPRGPRFRIPGCRPFIPCCSSTCQNKSFGPGSTLDHRRSSFTTLFALCHLSSLDPPLAKAYGSFCLDKVLSLGILSFAVWRESACPPGLQLIQHFLAISTRLVLTTRHRRHHLAPRHIHKPSPLRRGIITRTPGQF